MPRRPNPDPRVKKTTTATADGICGHRYTRRFGLRHLVGQPVTEDTKRLVAHMRAGVAEDMAREMCDTCFTVQATTEASQFEARLTNVLGLPALPVITGTAAMVGYALKLRRDRLDAMLAAASMELASWRIGLVANLVSESINLRFPTKTIQGEDASSGRCPAWSELAARVAANDVTLLTAPYTAHRHPVASPRGMSAWLLLRHAIRNDRQLTHETDAKRWIVGKKVYRSTDDTHHLFGFSELLAATVVSNNTSWESLSDAASAFDVLAGPTSEIATETFSQRAGVPFADVMEDISVMQALMGPAQYEDNTPF